MANFEGFVRPFTDVDTLPTRGVVAVPVPTPNVWLTAAGNGQTKSGNYSYSITTYADAVQQEENQEDDSVFLAFMAANKPPPRTGQPVLTGPRLEVGQMPTPPDLKTEALLSKPRMFKIYKRA